MKRLRGFGLEIDSEIELPAFAPGNPDVPADVRISLGPVDPPPSSAIAVTKWAKACPQGVWLSPDSGDLIQVRNGNEITIQPSVAQPSTTRSGENPERLVFVLASGFGTLLQQRGLLTLHCGAVATPTGIVGVLGVSGAGKSTTTNMLVRHGFPLVTDDILAVDTGQSPPQAHPAFAALKLCGDAIERFAPDHQFEPVHSARDKYRVPVDSFETDELNLRALYVIRRRPDVDVSIQSPNQAAAFRVLDRETFRRELLGAQGFRNQAFASLTRLAQSVPVHVLTRPTDGESHTEVEQALLAHLT